MLRIPTPSEHKNKDAIPLVNAELVKAPSGGYITIGSCDTDPDEIARMLRDAGWLVSISYTSIRFSPGSLHSNQEMSESVKAFPGIKVEVNPMNILIDSECPVILNQDEAFRSHDIAARIVIKNILDNNGCHSDNGKLDISNTSTNHNMMKIYDTAMQYMTRVGWMVNIKFDDDTDEALYFKWKAPRNKNHTKNSAIERITEISEMEM